MAKKNVDHKKAARGFFKGFKDFISKGSVIDLAVGVIIGGAFGKIVTSLVNDVIMPPIGLLIGGVNFQDLVIILRPAEIVNEVIVKNAVVIGYGKFIMIVLEFLIIAFVIYTVLTLIIRRRTFIEKLEAEEKARIEAEEKEKADAAKAKAVALEEQRASDEIMLLREIRDELRKIK